MEATSALRVQGQVRMDSSGCVHTRDKQRATAALSAANAAELGHFSTWGNLAEPSTGGLASSSPLAECGWSFPLNKQQFHFSHFLGFLWRGVEGTIFTEVIRKHV
jgi:hypothetical protein